MSEWSSRNNCSVDECFHESRVVVGMIRSARGWNVKRFERSNGLGNALYQTFTEAGS